MSTPPDSNIPAAQPPDCPYCGESLPNLGLYAWGVGGFRILNLFCPTCKRALHFQIFQQPPVEDGEGPRVHIPS
jgi:hypothetical protein